MIIRCLVCIPTYNNSGSILQVVQDTLNATDLPILILDDGSVTPVSTLIQESDRVSIHRLETNQGKGAAIQRAFQLAVSRGFTHLITMDGDGQHKPHDIKNMVEEILKFPWALIIGKRKFSGEHVPKSSQFGRKFSNFWVKYQTDATIEDSQSGFRSYPLFFVQNLSFFTRKYDFEIEVLIRLIWKKVQVREVAIDVYYPPPEERVSHFDKLWDNVKISLLNTVLVILSLLHSNMSRKKMIISAALGVFVGVIPIYGFQMYVAAALAFFFRLNFPLMFLFQQISLPPLIPLWTFLSLEIGSFLTGQSLALSFDHIMESAQRLIPVWFLGSLVLGLVLALLTALMVFALTMEKNKKKQWTGKDRGGKFGNWFMQKVTDTFGPNVSYFILWFICPYFYLFAPKAVLAQNQYFKISQPQMGFWERQLQTIKTFYKLGQVLVDNFYSNSKGPTYFNLIRNGKENPFRALEAGRGVILVGAHMGGWMFSSRIFATDEENGKKIKVNIVEFHVGQGQNASNKIDDKQLSYINNSQEAPIFRINQALTQNEMVVFMADRPGDQNLELIPFFGKLAPIDTAAFKVALAKKAPLSFSFGLKSSSRDYNLYITPAIYPEEFASYGKHGAVIELAKRYTENLEKFLRLYPNQWFNFFPFWSALSVSEIGEDSKPTKSHLVEAVK